MEQQPHVTRRKRSRFRPLHSFNLRTLFAVVTIFGILLGWELHFVRERKSILNELNSERRPDEIVLIPLEELEGGPESEFFTRCGKFDCYRVSLFRRLLGDSSCYALHLPASIDSKLIERIECAFPEAQLNITHADGRQLAFRDSLFEPDTDRLPNSGKVFKTGLK